jgi:UDP-N-acetylmuramoyl-tripeptide--D-alanyl-D-alanine ligase
MNTIWTSQTLRQALTGIDIPDGLAIGGVSIDTRTLQKNDLFIALKGDIGDGHAYVDAAFKAGAAAAIVRQDQNISAAGTCVAVQDTQIAMEQLGRYARKHSKARIIAVCGSVGKTGTKDMLSRLCTVLGKTHASKKSFNNHLGVPLSLANLPPDAQFGIFEVGMNHPGEIIPLAAQVRPEIALITTIDREHIEFFDNGLDGVCDANAEIFTGMDAKGTAVLNRDNPYFDRLKHHASVQGIKNIIGFGADAKSDARLLECKLFADHSRVTADILGQTITFRLSIPGRHIVQNTLGALAVIKTAGGDLDLAIPVLASAHAVEGRGNRHRVTLHPDQPVITLIDESYNANPASMTAAFDILELSTPAGHGRRIAVLGDMLELGVTGPELHKNLATGLNSADAVFCCGPLMKNLYDVLPAQQRTAHTADSQKLSPLVIEFLKPGDVVLVKGSFGSKTGLIVKDILKMAHNAKGQKHAV